MTSDVDLKVIFLGMGHVGKTSILHQFIGDGFTEETKSTVGALPRVKQWRSKRLCLWDTAGQEKYFAISSIYCRKADAAILVCDVMDQKSFDELPRFLEILRNAKEPDKDVYVVMVSNKIDLVKEGAMRVVKAEEASAFARQIKARHFETSAKTGFNIEEVFDAVIEHFYDVDKSETSSKSTPEQTRSNIKKIYSASSNNSKRESFRLGERPKEDEYEPVGCNCITGITDKNKREGRR
mmetsp:Transcript_27336/g.30449  ORF Transcript_27336/g.30449 Transcript_27336/m.30449 type:complete len:238 (-) Transcript_27336:61-774(-)